MSVFTTRKRNLSQRSGERAVKRQNATGGNELSTMGRRLSRFAPEVRSAEGKEEIKYAEEQFPGISFSKPISPWIGEVKRPWAETTPLAPLAPIIPLDLISSSRPFGLEDFGGERLTSRSIFSGGRPKYDFPCEVLVHRSDMKQVKGEIGNMVVPVRVWSAEERHYVTKPARLVVDVRALQTKDGRIYHLGSNDVGGNLGQNVCEDED